MAACRHNKEDSGIGQSRVSSTVSSCHNLPFVLMPALPPCRDCRLPYLISTLDVTTVNRDRARSRLSIINKSVMNLIQLHTERHQ
jgi:hypothetical protein